MGDGIRCPYCKKKLVEALHGTVSVRCRHCKHLVSVVGHDPDHDSEVRALKDEVVRVQSPEASQPLKRTQITRVAATGDNRFVGTDFKAR